MQKSLQVQDGPFDVRTEARVSSLTFLTKPTASRQQYNRPSDETLCERFR